MRKYDIAAYIWPSYTGKEVRSRIFWPDGIGEWQTVKKEHKKGDYEWSRKPLWGYVDEADPEVMRMQIQCAKSYGVNVFIYDWYWYDKRPFLENCLNDGFLKADNCLDMKFYIMWANHNANYTWDYRLSSSENTDVWLGAVTKEDFEIIGTRWLEQYFTKENYYKIDGKPVVAIYDIGNFITGLGGIDEAAECMNSLREKAKKYGLPGVHFQLIKWGKLTLDLSGVDKGKVEVDPALSKRMGFDSLTHYQMVHFTNVTRDYEEIIPDMVKEWNEVKKAYCEPYFPHVSIGWDNNPRFTSFRADVVRNNTPENFKKALREAKKFCDENCDVPLITVNSWNEWTETSYLEPDDLYGYGYLEAVREVFDIK